MMPQNSSSRSSRFAFKALRATALRWLTLFCASFFLLIAMFLSVPASVGAAPNSAIWGIGQYIMSFFHDDAASARKAERPAPANPYIEESDAETKARYAPQTYPDSAVPCTQSGVTTPVPLGASIQTYINAAGFNGDKLVLAAGTYTEQISINKCIFIEGAGIGQTTIKAPSAMVSSDIPGMGARASIVEARANSYSSVSNLTISGPVTFTNSTYGVFVGENAWLVMNDVHVTDIRLSSGNSGAQNGLGIVVGTSGANQIGRLEADNVTVDDYNKGGIVVDHAGSTATITNSTITGSGALGTGLAAQNGIQISRGATGSVTDSTIEDNTYMPTSWAASGILLFRAGDVSVNGNNFESNDVAIYNTWQEVGSPVLPPTPHADFLAHGNTIESGGWGVALDGPSGVVTNNVITGGLYGVDVGASNATVANIRSNSITGATTAGISFYSYPTQTSATSLDAHFNRISGNAIGLENNIAAVNVDAENNFWGCNEGPTIAPAGTPCNAVDGSGTIDFDPWLVLSQTVASASPINTGDTSVVSGTSLRMNSDSQDTFTLYGEHILDGTPLNYSATNGTLDTASTTFTQGLALAGTTFTAGGTFPTETTAIVTASLDSAADSVNIIINDEVAPTVTINQAAGQADPTNTPAITFDVVFSENVNGFDSSDINTAGSSAGIGGITVSPATGPASNYTVTINATSNGTVTASIPAGAANDDSGNANPNAASTSTDNVVSYFTGSLELVVDDDGLGTAFDCDANVPAYSTINAAVAAAGAGYTIRVCSGDYNEAATVNLAHDNLTIAGVNVSGVPNVNVTGSGPIFTVTGANLTVTGLQFTKTDSVSGQTVFQIQAPGFKALNNTFTATTPWTNGGGEPNIVFVTLGGGTGWEISGNTISDFSHAAYFNRIGSGDAVEGIVSNNTVNRTRGFGVEGAIVEFTNNTFETCAECKRDINLLNAALSQDYLDYYADRLALSQGNNNAFVDVHFTPEADSGRADTYVATTGSDTNAGTATSPFASIQQAIYDSSLTGKVTGTLPGGTVHVAAGTYVENINVSRGLTILGPNAGKNPNTTTRSPEAILMSSASDPTYAGFVRVVTLGARDITVDGLTIDGDNPNLTSGVVRNGADIDAGYGFYGPGLSDTRATVVNNIVKNMGEFGMWLSEYGSPNADARTVNSTVENNFVGNVSGGTYGQGIRIDRGAFTNVRNNVVRRASQGIVLESFMASGVIPATSEISNNKITASGYGIRFNHNYTGNGYIIANNDITSYVQAGSSATRFDGIRLESITGTVAVSVTGNTIIPDRTSLLAAGYTRVDGIFITNTFTTSPNISITNNRISNALRGIAHTVPAVPTVTCNALYGNNIGVFVGTDLGYDNDPSTATLGINLSNNSFRNNTSFGVQNDGTSPMTNAESNFWGAADGPSGQGPGSGDAVSTDVDFASFLTAESGCAPALPETHVPTTSPNGWFYWNDVAPEGIISPNDYAYGPGSPVLGIGSARMNPSLLGTTKLLFATLEFAGTRLADVNHFSYFTYVTSGNAPYVQMGIDADLTDSDDSWQGRIVWVPSANGTVVPGGWQYWDANEGLFYATQLPVRNACPVSDPCTKAELISAFPNIGLSNGPDLGLLGFRSDDASNASVDAVSIGTNTTFKTFDFEPTVPTLLSIVPIPAGPTNAASIDFTVTFSEAVTGFDLSDAVFSGISGTPSISGSGAVYTVTFTPDANQDGTLALNVAAGAANGNPNGTPTANAASASVDYDNVSPNVTFTYTGVDPTNQTLSFTAVFTEDMTGFDASDISISNGTVTNFQTVSASSYTFDVVPAASGSVTAGIPAGVATDPVGNGNNASTDITVTYDIDIPSVTVLHGGPASNTSPVTFTVTFSEPVTGFDAADVDLSSSTTGGILNSSVTNSGDDTNFTVTVSGMAQNGDVILNIPAGAAIDAANNGNSASTPASTGSDTIAFTVDSSTTVVTPANAMSELWGYYNDSTNAPIAGYDFVYGPGSPTLPIGSAGMRTQQSTGNSSDLLVFGTTKFNGTRLADITRLSYETYVDSTSGGGAPTLQFNVDYDLTDGDTSYQGRVVWVPSQNGTVTNDTWQTWDVITSGGLFWYSALSPVASECTQGSPCTLAAMLALHPNMGIHTDPIGALLFRVEANSNAAVDNLTVGISSEDTVFDFEPSVPGASIAYGGAAGPTNSTSIPFTVTFTEPVTDFDDATDVSITNGTFGSITPVSSTVYTVNVTPSADGTVTVSVPASVAVGDPSGVPNTASGSAGTVYDGTAPTAALTYFGTNPTNAVMAFSVTFSDSVDCNTLSGSSLTLVNGTASNFAQNGTNTCTFDVTAGGEGTVEVTVNAGVMTDAAGNSNTISNTISVQYDSVRPGVTITGDAASNTSPLTYTITFTEPVSGFDVNDIVWTGTTTNSTSGVLNVGFTANSATEYVVTVSGMSDSGDVVITVPENVAVDFTGGNGNTADTFTTAFTVDSTPVGVTATNAAFELWRYYNDTTNTYFTTYDFQYGPGTHPVGYGSAGMRSSVMGTEEIALMSSEFGGTRFADITKLTYRAYYATGATGGMANLQFNVDYDGVGGNDGWQGRVNFTPSMNDPVRAENRDTWEFWDVSHPNAKFWITQQQTNLSCTQGSPCTKAQMLAAYPNMRLHIDVGADPLTAFSALLFRTDGTGNAAVDDLTIGINSENQTFDFEPEPTVEIVAATPGAEPSTDNTFTVTISGMSSVPVTVDYATASGTATDGVDYATNTGTITFPADTTTLSQTITVTTIDDTIAEPTEDFTVGLSNASGATIANASATGTIADSGAYVSISGNIQQYNAPAPNTNLAGVTVNLAGSATQSTVTDSNGNYTFNVGLPTGGTYLVSPELTGKVFDPINRSYPVLNTNVGNADFVAYEPTGIPRNLRIVNTYQAGSPGPGSVAVPIVLDALGTEKGLSFSVTYDSALLSYTGIVCGADAINCDVSANNTGSAVGVELTHDSVFASGNGKEVVVLSFTTTPGTAHNTPLTFTNTPAFRDINDAFGNSVPANYLDGLVIFPQGFEGDLAGRSTGNGQLTGADITVLRQLVQGSLVADPTVNEFQRADTAPAGSKGNGLLTSADVTALRLYVANSTLTPAGGPMFSSVTPLSSFIVDPAKDNARSSLVAGDLRIVSQSGSAGNTVVVPLEVDSSGNENGVTMSIQFDPSVLTYVNSTLGADASSQSGTTFDRNLTQIGSGRLGLAMTLDIGVTYNPGPREVYLVTFQVNANADSGVTPITFVTQPLFTEINDTVGNTLPMNLINGTVNILSPTAANAAVEGRVLTADGRPIANTVVVVQGQLGEEPVSVRSNSFGRYRIPGLRTGRSYIVSARAKGYSFEPMAITVNDQITNLNLVAGK